MTAVIWMMVQATTLNPLAITPSFRSRPTYQKYPHKKSLQSMVLRELSEFHTTVRYFTDYTDGSLEENVDMVMRQLNRGDVVIVFDEATGIANIIPIEDIRSISEEEW